MDFPTFLSCLKLGPRHFTDSGTFVAVVHIEKVITGHLATIVLIALTQISLHCVGMAFRGHHRLRQIASNIFSLGGIHSVAVAHFGGSL